MFVKLKIQVKVNPMFKGMSTNMSHSFLRSGIHKCQKQSA